MALLQKDQTLGASVVIRATPEVVYSVISDVTRVGAWSPEAKRAKWIAPDRFRTWNQRRFAIWRTEARVVSAERGQRFSFIVELFGKDWTQWTYELEPAAEGATKLTEVFRMCIALPLSAVTFERVCLFVWDRTADLQSNLEQSVNRVRDVVEAGRHR